MDTKQKVIAGVLIAGIIVAALILYRLQLKGTGTIKTLNLEVYGNPELTEKVTTIDWGAIGAGETKGAYLWIKNVGNINGSLLLEAKNWNPNTASQYMSLTWNYTDTILAPQDIILVELRLQAFQNITGINNFSMDIEITIYGNH